jgi:hypothetical protein
VQVSSINLTGFGKTDNIDCSHDITLIALPVTLMTREFIQKRLFPGFSGPTGLSHGFGTVAATSPIAFRDERPTGPKG